MGRGRGGMNRGFGGFARGGHGGGRRQAARYGGKPFFGPPQSSPRGRKRGLGPVPPAASEEPPAAEAKTGAEAAADSPVALVNIEACTGCGVCAVACPADAIVIEEKAAIVDFALCTGCGLCALRCPQEAIAMGQRPAAS